MSKEIKVRSVAVTALVPLLGPLLLGPLFVAVAPGCAPIVAEAPFPARPDGTEPGDLLGPFDGRAIDSATSKPIAGAVVFASWGFELGRGLVAPGGGDTLSVETDSDGRYRIPRLPHIPRGRERVARFTVVIYKPGWIAWRSDRRFEDDGTRHDFAQSQAVARLDRFAPGTSHVRHLRFAGGSGALRRALAGEIVKASLELSGGEAPTGPIEPAGPLLDATPLLSADELRAVTGYAGDLELGRLGDLPQTGNYDSRHFRAVGKPESYDAAIRVWHPATPALATARWQKLLEEVPNLEKKDELGDASLRGHDGKILSVAALLKDKRLVVQLNCGVDQCRDHAQAVALLRRILQRADKLEIKVDKKPDAKKSDDKAEPKAEGEAETPK